MADTIMHVAKTWQITIAFLIIMFSILLLGYVAQSNISKISTNTEALEAIEYTQCLDLNVAKKGTNDVLDSLIAAVSITNSIGTVEKADRIARYKKIIVSYTDCSVFK